MGTSTGIVTAAVVIPLALIFAGLLWQHFGSRRDAVRFPPPGERFDIGGHHLHLHRAGRGAPTVVFDSALGATSLSWELVQPSIAEFTTSCSYDRAGTGWSEARPQAATIERNADELFRLLEAAAVPKPYILVGHSYGGLTARYFTDRYRDASAGLVLLDCADPQQWIDLKPEDRRKIVHGTRLARRGAWIARLGLARFIIFLADSGAARVARSAASLLGDGMPGPTQNRFLSPLDRMPGRVRQILKWFWTEPAFYRALADQIAGVPAGARLVAAGRSYGDLPLVVVSAENPDPEWEPRQRQMAELSTRGHHVSASESSHWIPVDRPDLVVEVIRAVVETARNDLEDGPGDPADLSRSFSTATKEHGSCHRPSIRAEETR